MSLFGCASFRKREQVNLMAGHGLGMDPTGRTEGLVVGMGEDVQYAHGCSLVDRRKLEYLLEHGIFLVKYPEDSDIALKMDCREELWLN